MAAQEDRKPGFFANALVGTTFTVLSGLSFLVVCMLLPMVGAAGNAAPFAEQNRRAFAIFLLVSLALSLLAIGSKLARRKVDQSPRPAFSFALCALTTLLLVALFTGMLSL